jgi:hypothetical protein
MFYRGPGFLAVVQYDLAHPQPPTPLPIAKKGCISFSVFPRVAGRAYLREGGGGAKSYDDEKAWSSINHSIYSLPKPIILNIVKAWTV